MSQKYSPIRMNCDYCGFRGEYAVEIESRRGKWVCVDMKACDNRDNENHEAEVRALRKSQREGNELTDNEKAKLSE